MPDPLDLAQNVGKDNEALEELMIEGLVCFEDPLNVLIECEQQDEDEGLPKGVSLQLYYFNLNITKR